MIWELSLAPNFNMFLDPDVSLFPYKHVSKLRTGGVQKINNQRRKEGNLMD